MPWKLPDVVAAADWSICPRKRWIARAVKKDAAYEAQGAERVCDSAELLVAMKREASAGGRVLVGFDFPIGLPRSYAKSAKVVSFLRLLPELGQGQWAMFYDVATTRAEIGLRRPFYPDKPGGKRMCHLEKKIGPRHAWLRRCDRATRRRSKASALFWTLGGKQVGKAAISGWQELLTPAIRGGAARIWPFSGKLDRLLAKPGVILAEVYPAESYCHVGVKFPGGEGGGKRSQEARIAQSDAIVSFAKRTNVRLSPELKRQIGEGFGKTRGGEDPFDATVAMLSMIGTLTEGGPWLPDDPAVCAVEGWIFDQRRVGRLSGRRATG